MNILQITAWLIIGSGLSFVLISGVVKERAQVCKEVKITFLDQKLINMIDREEVYNNLWPVQLKERPEGKRITTIDLFRLEKQLEKNPWVQHANLYFDNRNVLQIDVQQRSPVARVFTPEGNSFYLDGDFNLLPLKSTDYLVLPVFTNFYINPNGIKSADSVLLARITGLSKFILKNPFWMAQIESVYINPDYSFDVTTQLGEQLVRIGTRSDWETLFYKLKMLYLKFSEEKSWAKYSTIDLQYKDQVVCEKSGINLIVSDSSRIDSTVVTTNTLTNNINSIVNPSKK